MECYILNFLYRKNPQESEKFHERMCMIEPRAPPFRGLIGVHGSSRRERVHLVEKEHTRRRRPRAREQLPHRPLALAHEFVQQLGPLHAHAPICYQVPSRVASDTPAWSLLRTVHLDRDEVGAAFIGDRLCQQRLAAARRPEKQHPSWRGKPHGSKLLRVFDWLCDRKRQLFPHLHAKSNMSPTSCSILVSGSSSKARCLTFLQLRPAKAMAHVHFHGNQWLSRLLSLQLP